MKTLDVCGLSCPEPVVRTQAALKTLPAGESLAVLADTATARDNILRTAAQAGCLARADTDGDAFRIVLTKA